MNMNDKIFVLTTVYGDFRLLYKNSDLRQYGILDHTHSITDRVVVCLLLICQYIAFIVTLIPKWSLKLSINSSMLLPSHYPFLHICETFFLLFGCGPDGNSVVEHTLVFPQAFVHANVQTRSIADERVSFWTVRNSRLYHTVKDVFFISCLFVESGISLEFLFHLHDLSFVLFLHAIEFSLIIFIFSLFARLPHLKDK